MTFECGEVWRQDQYGARELFWPSLDELLENLHRSTGRVHVFFIDKKQSEQRVRMLDENEVGLNFPRWSRLPDSGMLPRTVFRQIAEKSEDRYEPLWGCCTVTKAEGQTELRPSIADSAATRPLHSSRMIGSYKSDKRKADRAAEQFEAERMLKMLETQLPYVVSAQGD